MLKHNSQGEKFIQWGFVIVGRMMYSKRTVQLLSFRKQIMGWETRDALPKTLCLTEVTTVQSAHVSVSERKVSENHLLILNMAFSSLAYLLLQRETHSSVDSGGSRGEGGEGGVSTEEKMSISTISFSLQTNNGQCL